MKTIYILRHAQAANAPGGLDHERPLTDLGREQARKLGRIMKEKNHAPDFVYCSTALRTRETFAGLQEILGDIKHIFTPVIYKGAMQDLVQLLKESDDRHEKVLIIGHNPVIHELASSLGQDGPEALMTKLMNAYAPATLSVVESGIAAWNALTTETGRLKDLIEPG